MNSDNDSFLVLAQRSIFLKLVNAVVLCVNASFAVYAQTPSAGPAAPRSEVMDRDEQSTDSFVPVITMEQFYSGATRLQGYRVQIFKDGRGIYHGLRNVKTLGEVRFDLRPEQVEKILGEFEKFKFWRVPESQYGVPRGRAQLNLAFTLRSDDTSKTVRFGGQNHGVMLQKVIDDQVHSEQWRCPYVDDRNVELCASRERYARYAVPDFLNLDLPKLMENYK